jgi:hypothetical protein
MDIGKLGLSRFDLVVFILDLMAFPFISSLGWHIDTLCGMFGFFVLSFFFFLFAFRLVYFNASMNLQIEPCILVAYS